MKVVNIGNIAEAYICDDLPAMGIVIEATLDELERLPNLTYKEVTISATPRRNCDRFGGDNVKLQKAYYLECGREYDPRDPISRQTYLVGYGNWLLATATEKEGGNDEQK